MAVAMAMESSAYPGDEDARLLARWTRDDDREAFGRLLERHAAVCWRLAYRVRGNAADADDALQEAFMQAMRHARSHRGGSVRAWLLAITANSARDQRRRARTRVRYERSGAAAAPPPPSDEDTVARVRDALARLPETYAVPVMLAYLEGMTAEAIGQVLHLTAAAVRKRCERGLARLRSDPTLPSAMGVPHLLASLPIASPTDACHEMALRVVRVTPATTRTLPMVAATILTTVAGAMAVVAIHPWPKPSHVPARVAAAAPPVPQPVEDPDAHLLRQRVSFTIVQEDVGGGIRELALALPAGSSFCRDQPILTTTLAPTLITRAFTDVTVRQALDALMPSDAAWYLSHGWLSVYRPRGTAPPADDIGLDTLRTLLLRWARTGDERALQAAYADTSNFYDFDLPVPALSQDAEVRAAVDRRLQHMLADATTLPPPRAIVIAGYLGLEDLAPAFRRLLTAAPAPLPLVEAAQPIRDAAEGAVEERWALIAALGWMRDEQAVGILSTIAHDDGGWRILCGYGLPGDHVIVAPQAPQANRMSSFRLSWFERHRTAAVRALAHIASPSAVIALRGVLTDRHAYTPRWIAARALAVLGDRASLPALHDALDHVRQGLQAERWSRSAASERPATTDNPEGDPESRALCWAIGRLDGAHGVGEVLRLTTDPRLRCAAFRALSDLRDARIAPQLLGLLRNDHDLALEFDRDPDDPQGSHEPDRYLSWAIAAQANASTTLVAALAEPGDHDAPWRRIAIRILGRTRTEQAASWLGRRATNPLLDARLRIGATAALGWTDQPSALQALERLLAHDQDRNVRCAAVDAIAILGGHFQHTITVDGVVSAPDAFLARALLHDPDPLVRAEAAAESRRGDRQAWIGTWIDALQSENDPGVLAKLVFALGQERFHSLPVHDRHRAVAAIALAPMQAQPHAHEELVQWLQNPNTDHETSQALTTALAARRADGVAGVEEVAARIDAILHTTPPPTSY